MGEIIGNPKFDLKVYMIGMPPPPRFNVAGILRQRVIFGPGPPGYSNFWQH